MQKLNNYFDTNWLVIAVAFTAIVILCTHIPQELMPSQLQKSGLDKLQHFVAYGAITFLFILSLKSSLSLFSAFLLFFATLIHLLISQLNMIILWLAMFVANFIVSLVMLLVVNLYLGLYYDNASANQIFVIGKTELDFGWHHVVFTYDGSSSASGVELYIDTQKQEKHISTDALTNTIQTTAPLNFGAVNNSAALLWFMLNPITYPVLLQFFMIYLEYKNIIQF